MVFKPAYKKQYMRWYLTSARRHFQKLILLFTSIGIAFILVAQDKQVDINVNVKKDNFWGQPWVWVVGAAVFILLLVAILRRGGRRNG
jgi:cell division protein FtsW (lipid II flippase)